MSFPENILGHLKPNKSPLHCEQIGTSTPGLNPVVVVESTSHIFNSPVNTSAALDKFPPDLLSTILSRAGITRGDESHPVRIKLINYLTGGFEAGGWGTRRITLITPSGCIRESRPCVNYFNNLELKEVTAMTILSQRKRNWITRYGSLATFWTSLLYGFTEIGNSTSRTVTCGAVALSSIALTSIERRRRESFANKVIDHLVDGKDSM